MKCTKSYKQVLLTNWGLRELHKGKSYAEVLLEMKRLKRKTIAEIKKIMEGESK